MATQLFFRTENAEIDTGDADQKLDGTTSTWDAEALSTSRGSALSAFSTSTVDGPTNGVEHGSDSTPRVWYSPALDADVTISGTITFNLWASETSMSANAAVNCLIEKIDGATGAITQIIKTTRTTELGTSIAAANFTQAPAAGVACKRGDRLRVRVFFDDAGTMGSGFFCSFGYSGPTAGANGDSYFTLTETLSFVSEPAGTKLYLTGDFAEVGSKLSFETGTEFPGVVLNDGINTGSPAPGTAFSQTYLPQSTWLSPSLNAFTLGGAIRFNVWAKRSTLDPNLALGATVSVVDSDGISNEVVWGDALLRDKISSTTSTVQRWLVTGDDLSVSAGRKIKVQIYADNPGATSVPANANIVTSYNENVNDVEGDSWVVLTQTVTSSFVNPDVFGPDTVVFSPTVTQQLVVQVPLLSATTSVFNPTVIDRDVVGVPLLSAVAVAFEPSATGGVTVTERFFVIIV